MTSTTVDGSMKLTGKHVLLALLGFFGTVIAVNVVFIVLALDTWTGLTTNRSYQEGLTYNEAIRDAEAQRALGWNAELEVIRKASDGDDVAVSVSLLLKDAAGAPITAQNVTLSFRHPMNEKIDQTVTLSPAGDGRYTGEATLATAGNWDTRLIAKTADGKTFRQDGAVWIK